MVSTDHGGGAPASTTTRSASFDDLFIRNWDAMVALAVLLVDDRASAEDVVQDAFSGLHRHWDTLTDPSKALPYLRRSVVNGARSTLRRRRTARSWATWQTAEPPPSLSAEDLVLRDHEHREVLEALSGLPPRQREVLVLRYWAGLDESETAATMGITRGTVKSSSHRGLRSLHRTLAGDDRRDGDQRRPTAGGQQR